MTLSRSRLKSANGGTRTAFGLALLNASLFLPVGLHLPYFPVWLNARGLTASEIASVLATPMIVRVVATPLVSHLADKRGAALMIAVCALVMLSGYCGLVLAQGFAPIFAVSILVVTAQGIMPSLADALTLGEIQRLEIAGLPAFPYGYIRVFASAAVLAAMLLSANLVQFFPGEHIVLALAGLTVPSALIGGFIAAKARKAAKPHDGKQSGLTANRRSRWLAFLCIGSAALIHASHVELYSFSTLHWQAEGLSAALVSLAWSTSIVFEALFFVASGRFFPNETHAAALLMAGGASATLRWLLMSLDPVPALIFVLQAMHGLSFAATAIGSILLLGSLAGPAHSARMQGWLSAVIALSMAASTFLCGILTSGYGEKAYLAMAGFAAIGLALAVGAGFVKAGAEQDYVGPPT
ncbi:MAG TPA: MFS transporter [Beijerinckia sp.]|nr:MFS transporter [Beijerinckia sp.]